MVLQNQLGLNKHQSYSHEKNYYADSSHGQMMRPSGYCSTMPFSHPTNNNHMMMGQHHSGYYESHGHGHGNYGSHGHMPHDSTNFSSSPTMVHSDGGYGGGMQQSSHAHMSSMSMGHHGRVHGHGHGYGGSHQNSYSQKTNWALKNLDD
ncbi:uncharacterized protein LOC129875742 [Solanum dulcamara]|uniref:uncharacterized protein LOC129875742 n=1 Tax=Solanum dulcamara TaxID=45834 RepID=UPI0024867ED0|nr:uncharacterized protein LOC129875742 [Solanum dulcamara]